MNKAVLISIQPKWCELIANGKKTVEVRKTAPKLQTPFKCYIYCTKGKDGRGRHLFINEVGKRKDYGITERWTFENQTLIVNGGYAAYECYLADGKVIGEFVCDYVVPFRIDCEMSVPVESFQQSALSWKEFIEYAGDKPYIYGWHISDLKIYDKPKELGEFEKPCICKDTYEGEEYCDCLECDLAGDSDYGVIACDRHLTRPPQSWCYVEELRG